VLVAGAAGALGLRQLPAMAFRESLRQMLNGMFPVSHRPIVQRFRGGLIFKAHRLCVSLNPDSESRSSARRWRAW